MLELEKKFLGPAIALCVADRAGESAMEPWTNVRQGHLHPSPQLNV